MFLFIFSYSPPKKQFFKNDKRRKREKESFKEGICSNTSVIIARIFV